MNKEKINHLINKIETLLNQLKIELSFDLSQRSSQKYNVKKIKRKKKKKRIGPTKTIENLINARFFNSFKTDLDVMKELKKKALIFKRKDVATALRRFVRKEMLDREGGGAKGNPWKYKGK